MIGTIRLSLIEYCPILGVNNSKRVITAEIIIEKVKERDPSNVSRIPGKSG